MVFQNIPVKVCVLVSEIFLFIIIMTTFLHNPKSTKCLKEFYILWDVQDISEELISCYLHPLYNRERQHSSIKYNQLLFLFAQNERRVEQKTEPKTFELHVGVWLVRMFGETSSPLDQNLPSYMTSRTPTQLMWPRLSSACPPCKFSWSHLFHSATYTMHVDTLPSRMLLMQFTRHFRRQHLRPVYFRRQVYFLLFSFNQDFHRSIDRCQRGLQGNIQLFSEVIM